MLAPLLEGWRPSYRNPESAPERSSCINLYPTSHLCLVLHFLMFLFLQRCLLFIFSDLPRVYCLLFMFSDLPRVLNMPVRIFLPRNMEGHIKCSVEANPPFTLIVWTKNERIIDFTHTSRLKLNKDGTLVINDVDANDEGRYTCTPYSPLGAGRSSSVVQIHVRGQHSFLLSILELYVCVY